ncbi:protein deltex-like isoform X1 [Penaeus vannamei]|uniref:protein deltex-like isoform X1 n=1 Tax=Penaeus vannamei TaxID=6689 RepID=UPI000F65C51B|nr:protein deltex-like isoform X1 [Penaeus vannamei]XP_027225006.1 protein deltex-like isoform X1 [Penaeus vannamei]XP_027225007.1 protein deltex-like isoform X1 [Penaeus vannamei]XP_027225008.1 protein deltex-like isoform X1 [Penaeus vannamei]
MASAKQGLYVVVWEWENKQRRWRPYPPEVTQLLERAHSKNLRSAFLGDSDPALNNYSVNLSTMQQECKVTKEIVNVRRNFYPQSSPAGQGAVWQWSGDKPGDWHMYDMCVQCVIEESWGSGAQTVDLSKAYPMCPYVINFCNLTQMNSRTNFIRSIRRVQQASYPVGKPPQQSRQVQGASSSTNNAASNNCGRVRPGTSSGVDRPRMRGNRGDDDFALADAKPRNFLNKMFGRGNSGNSGPNGTTKGGSLSPNSDHSNGRGGMNAWNGNNCASPPKPMPRTTLSSPVASNPPVPKPRTSVPYSKPVQHQHYHQQHEKQHPQHQQHHEHQHQHHPHHHLHHQNQLQKQHLQQHHHQPMQQRHCQQYPDDREDWVDMSRILRNDSGVGRFGSSHTLDSDCSSMQSGRRPSLDTISTYLSQDSCNVEDDSSHMARFHNQDESKFVQDLIQVDGAEENMDDDVFDEDKEVCEVMRGGAGQISPALLHSTSPIHSHHVHHQRQMSHSQVPSQQHCQFMPIAAAKNGSDLNLQQNGVKRKRTGERATPGHPRMEDVDDVENCQDIPIYANHTQRRHSHQKAQYGSRAPIAAEDRLLVQYTQAVDLPPDETCSICMWSLQESSGYSDDENEGAGNGMHLGGAMRYRVVSLILCGHLFHQACIREMAKSSPHFLECPNCKTLHGEKLGNQPDGKMSVIIVQRSLPGHSDCNTIQITYNIQSGIQGPEHPHPGLPYKAIGFPRTAYLPNNAKGKKVLSLLREAWQRRLIFTVGTSVTTGTQDAVTWNEIHHKTEWNNNTGHGYPDPNYLDNILRELAAHGVTETTLV